MFEIGERYEIATGPGDQESDTFYTVREVNLPLIKVVDGVGREYIFNTHSPSFVSAKRPDPDYVHNPSIYDPLPQPSRTIGEDGWPIGR